MAALEDLDEVRSSDGRLQVTSPGQPDGTPRELPGSAPAALEAATGPIVEGKVIESRQDEQ